MRRTSFARGFASTSTRCRRREAGSGRASDGVASRAGRARGRLVVALLSVGLAAGAAHAQAPAKVYGLEVETRENDQRLLIFADGPITHRIDETAPNRFVVVVPRAALDPSAPRRVRPGRGGTILAVRASERMARDAPEVRIEVRRRPGPRPTVEARGSALALVFEGGAPVERLALAMEDEDLRRFVETVAKATGETFLFDEKLQGRISIASSEGVMPGELRGILDTVLLMEGFVALPTPTGAYKVVPLQEGRGQAGLVGEPDPRSERMRATFLRLVSADVRSVVTMLQPWLGQRALAVAQPETNGLVLAASEVRLHQLLGVIRLLDRAAAEELLIRRVRHREVGEIASFLEGAAGDAATPRERAQIWSDERTNTIVVKAPPERLAELRVWIEELDRPPPAEGVLHVRKVRHADPEALAGILREVAAGTPAPGSGPAGAPLPVAAQGLRGRPFTVVADPPTSSLVIQADPATYTIVEGLLDVLDVSPPRIHVEAVIVEVVRDSSFEIGFDALVPFTDPDSPGDFIGTAFLDPTGSGLLQPGASSAQRGFAARISREPVVIPVVDDMGNVVELVIPRETAVIQASESQVEARVLSRPHIFGVSGEEHEITAGDNIPIRQSAITEGATGALENQINILRQDVGVTLRIRPTLGQGGRVRLDLEVESTRVTASAAGDVNVVGPTVRNRRLDTTLWLADGEIAVVGTGDFPEYASVVTGTPWFKDIPFFGHFFRAVRERRMEVSLLITAQVRIHGDDSDVLAETIRRRLAFERILSREGGLGVEDGPYALRVATRALADDAQAIARGLTQKGDRARVLRWEYEGDEHFDVYLVGLETEEISEASLRARSDGWYPELVVVEGRGSS